jgi:hypothetical protein
VALQAGPEAVAKQVPRFSVTAAVRSAQLASKELAESRARRRRRREDYILLQVTIPRLRLQPTVDESNRRSELLHWQKLLYRMPMQLDTHCLMPRNMTGMLLCCRRGCAPKLWQRQALETLASVMLQPPVAPRAPAHIISTTLELGQAMSWGSYILHCCLAAALPPRPEASTGTPCHNTTSVLMVCQSTCTSVKDWKSPVSFRGRNERASSYVHAQTQTSGGVIRSQATHTSCWCVNTTKWFRSILDVTVQASCVGGLMFDADITADTAAKNWPVVSFLPSLHPTTIWLRSTGRRVGASACLLCAPAVSWTRRQLSSMASFAVTAKASAFLSGAQLRSAPRPTAGRPHRCSSAITGTQALRT